MLAKLSEALFVDTLRRYVASLPRQQTGWLTGARDPIVGKSLGLLEPPMTYLTRWRLQLAVRSLEKTSRGVADIAAEVGYESEAAFSRAFKREFGQPPGRYRSDRRNAPSAAQSASV